MNRTIAKSRKTPTKTAVKPAKASRAATGASKPAPIVADPAAFAPGQKWQLELGHAEVVHVGKVLIDYRYYKVATQKHVPVETKTLVDFAATLKKNKAKLVTN